MIIRYSRTLFVITAIVTAACGKKGPPLAPVVPVPSAVDHLTTRRVGNDVFITLTVPGKNIDASVPVNISRVEVYAYTGRVAPRPMRWLELGTFVAKLPVAPINPATPTVPPDPSAGALPGTSVTIRDVLTPQAMAEGKVDVLPVRRGSTPAPATRVDTSTLPLRRFYLLIPMSSRDRAGPPKVVDLPLDVIPDPPQQVQTTYTASETSVSWEPSGGVIGFLFEHALIPEPSPSDDFEIVPASTAARGPTTPSGPVRYNVYRDPPPALPAGTLPPVNAAWSMLPAMPLNEAPLTTLAFTDDVEFGTERCYTVRAVRGAAANVVESEPSAPACVGAVDVFPPAPPTALAAVAAEGAISLIWEPSFEPDLAGYVVLRGRVGDATLQRLTPLPIMEARYRDADVVAGMQYVYAVVAVDKAMPPNVSMESMRVIETAR